MQVHGVAVDVGVVNELDIVVLVKDDREAVLADVLLLILDVAANDSLITCSWATEKELLGDFTRRSSKNEGRGGRDRHR